MFEYFANTYPHIGPPVAIVPTPEEYDPIALSILFSATNGYEALIAEKLVFL